MKKLFCIMALGAISFGTVMAAAPVNHTAAVMKSDTTKKVKKVKVKKDGTYKVKTKKDSVGNG